MIKWIVQQNLTNPKTLHELQNLSQKHHFAYEEIRVIPFSDTLDYDLPEDCIPIFYGSTTLMLTAYNNPSLRKGIFFNEQTFSLQNYVSRWKEDMLNYDTFFFTVKELLEKNLGADKSYFVRPDGDTKLFAGTVMNVTQFQEKLPLLLDSNPQMDENTVICFSPVKTIQKEWRNFVVNKKVVSAARYAVLGNVSVDQTDVPSDMIEFVEKQCSIYTPEDIFVMDIAWVNNEYKIIECNCFNATGFYDYNIESIVLKINEHLLNQ